MFWRFYMCNTNDIFDKIKIFGSSYWGSTAKTGGLLGIKQTYVYIICYIWQTTLFCQHQLTPDSKAHGANVGPIWGRQDPCGPHVGPMNFALWDNIVLFLTTCGVHYCSVSCQYVTTTFLLQICNFPCLSRNVRCIILSQFISIYT